MAVEGPPLEFTSRVLIIGCTGCKQRREFMINADGSPNTAHTTNLVHLIYVAADAAKYDVKDGILADVAPTLLDMLGLPQPKEMTGSSLLVKK